MILVYQDNATRTRFLDLVGAERPAIRSRFEEARFLPHVLVRPLETEDTHWVQEQAGRFGKVFQEERYRFVGA